MAATTLFVRISVETKAVSTGTLTGSQPCMREIFFGKSSHLGTSLVMVITTFLWYRITREELRQTTPGPLKAEELRWALNSIPPKCQALSAQDGGRNSKMPVICNGTRWLIRAMP